MQHVSVQCVLEQTKITKMIARPTHLYTHICIHFEQVTYFLPILPILPILDTSTIALKASETRRNCHCLMTSVARNRMPQILAVYAEIKIFNRKMTFT